MTRSVRGRVLVALVLFLAVATLVVVGATAAPARTPVAGGPAALQRSLQESRTSPPRAFASCTRLVRYGRRYLARTHGVPETPVQPLAESTGPPSPAPSGPTPSAGPETSGGSEGAPSYSTTNNQEPGIEEPDSVKTDGSTIFAVSGQTLYAAAVSGGTSKLIDSLPLGPTGYGSQLLLEGSHLLVISGAGPPGPVPLVAQRPPAGGPGIYPSPYYYRGETKIENVDVSDPSAMRVISTASIDGSFVDARQNGSTARIVISSAPRAIAEPALRGRISGFVPSWRYHSLRSGRRFHRLVAGCGRIAQPAQFSGLGMVTIFTIDFAHGLYSAATDSLMADAQVVYGSQRSIYLATQRWIDPATPVSRLGAARTQIDRFDASKPRETAFLASGEVPGYLLNQFSLSESDGYLRVATTSSPDFWDGEVPQVPSQSYVTVLATRGDQLVPVGRLSGLGRGQRIYSVRFVGDTGYVVTFRQVDPLYTIDLGDPTAPRVVGRLELDGYSSYLHPLGNSLLLGVGQDVGTDNEPSGTQLELFDVSDPGAPKLLGKTTLGQGSSSQAQYDHHAFLFWAPAHLIVLPVQIFPASGGPPTPAPGGPPTPAPGSTGTSTTPNRDPQGTDQQFTGAIGLRVDSRGISNLGRVSHPATDGYIPPITRSLVIAQRLYTLSAEGILASRLDTLAPVAFVAFPSSPQPPPPPGATGSPTK